MSAVFPPPPPLASETNPLWTDDAAEEPCMPPSRRIFCNRSLNMAAVRAVGFDMDYTLAQYKPETFEVLAHDETVKKLVSAFGYPKVGVLVVGSVWGWVPVQGCTCMDHG